MWAVDPATTNAAGKDARVAEPDRREGRARGHLRCRRSRRLRSTLASTTATPWHDVYRVTISTGRRSDPQNTERIAGWNFDLQGSSVWRSASRTTSTGS